MPPPLPLAVPVEDSSGVVRETWRGVTIVRDVSCEAGKPELRSAWRTAI